MMTEFEHAAELDAIARLELVESGAAPGGVLALAGRESGTFRGYVGCAGTLSRPFGRAPVELDTPYDLASVTKPLTAAVAARLVRKGTLALDAALGDLVPEARGTASEAAPIELLLAHRAGLEAHRPLFEPLACGRPFDRARALRAAASARRIDCTGTISSGGFAPLYSDLGFLLAGAAIERAAGRALDELVAQELDRPLGTHLGSVRRWRARDPAFAKRVAPTETVAWRGGALSGVVHDENAWALAGHGSAGHAGAFGTASDVARFGVALLEALAGRDDGWLSARDLEPFVRERDGGSLRAGFDGRSPGASSAAGTRSSPGTIGHLGFTGTSLWCDPDAELVTVVLTNRVCPTREDVRLRSVRPAVQDALYALAGRR
jgi:CubicO group peptidase (beta-lactamase class C family)